MFKKWGGILKSHLVSGSKVKSSVGHGTLNLHDKRVFPEGGGQSQSILKWSQPGSTDFVMLFGH